MKKIESLSFAELVINPEDERIQNLFKEVIAKPNQDFEILYKDKLIARITYVENSVNIEQFSDHNHAFYRPFKRNYTSTWAAQKDIEQWLYSRCFPPRRFNYRQLVHDLHIKQPYGHEFLEYLVILRLTHGILLEDYFWIRFKGEELTYDEVKLRD